MTMSTNSEKVEMKQKPPLVVKTTTGYSNMVPTFLLKLVSLLEETEYDNFVSWSDDGNSFVVRDQSGFSKHVLPKYFKHNKFASFVRQLNMYGFRKVTSLQQGGLLNQQESIEFFHPYFKRGDINLLQYIKRKVTQSSRVEDLNNVLEDVQDVKVMQNDITKQISDIRRENEDLWREVVSLRQKHAHQQKVVNRLIQFLVSLVQHHGVGTKRPLQLMIEDGSSDTPLKKKCKLGASSSSLLLDGPQITEVPPNYPTLSAEAESNDFVVNDVFNQPVTVTEVPQTDSNTTTAFSSYDAANNFNTKLTDLKDQTTDNTFLSLNEGNDSDVNDLLDSLVQPNQSETEINPPKTSEDKQISVAMPSSQMAIPQSPKALNSNIDLIQNNLHNIKRRLSNNEQIKLDYDLIRELFNTSMDITPTPPNIYETAVPEPGGNELVQYSGNLFPPQENNDDTNNLDDLLGSLKD